MATITLSDDQFARLLELARRYHRTPEQLVGDCINDFPLTISPNASAHAVAIGTPEYNQRWEAFMQLVGSIQHGQPLSNDDIDELIGEEAAQSHDAGIRDATNRTATSNPTQPT